MKNLVKIESDIPLDLDLSTIEDSEIKFRRIVTRLISASSQIAVQTRSGPAHTAFLERDVIEILRKSKSSSFSLNKGEGTVIGTVAGFNIVEKNDSDSIIRVSRDDTRVLEYNTETKTYQIIDQERETYLTFKLKI